MSRSERFDLGDGHSFEFVSDKSGINGIDYFHQNKEGNECSGWIPFNGSSWGNRFGNKGWDVQSLHPLTISPSLLCRACGDHGFIRNGKWVRA